MKKGMFAASFDPITRGHIHLIERASKLVDHLYVVLSNNPQKTYLFTAGERMDQVKSALTHLDNVSFVLQKQGITIHLAQDLGVEVFFRGIRNPQDAAFEASLDHHNHRMAPQVETLLLMSYPQYTYVSSSMVKELAQFGGDYQTMVTPQVAQALADRYGAGDRSHLDYELEDKA